MLLSPQVIEDHRVHKYQYAHILGIYHANVLYGGLELGKPSLPAHCMDFLWVRWFKVIENLPAQSGWTLGCLDQLKFCFWSNEQVFGFVDLAQVLWACHIIPCFAQEKQYQDGKRLSGCAQNHKD